MNSQLSPKAVIGGVVAVIALIAGIYYFVSKGSGAGSLEGQKPPGMPAGVADEFNNRMGGAAPGGAPMPTGPGAGAGAPGPGPGGPPGGMRMTGPGNMGGR